MKALFAAVLALAALVSVRANDRFDVAVYYFGNYHLDPRNEARLGKGWSEWKIVCDRLAAKPDAPRIITVNSWNEWTEGSYLEPDKTNGFGYMDAVKGVFGGKSENQHTHKTNK